MESRDDGGKDIRRPDWSSLPDLAVHKIAMKVCAASFLILGGVCKAWRTVWKDAKADFLSSQTPRSLLLFDRPPSSDSFYTFYDIIDGGFVKTPLLPAGIVDGLCFIGKSQGHLIALDAATKRIPSILNPLTGTRFDFPALRPNLSFDYALLTEPVSGGRCRLLLVNVCIPGGFRDGRVSILASLLDRPRWTTFFIPEPVKDAIAYEGKLFVELMFYMVVIDMETRAQDFIPIYPNGGAMCGFFAVSSEGDLLQLKLKRKSGSVIGIKHCLNSGGQWRQKLVVWPSDRGVFLTWQRSDLFCTLNDDCSRKGIGHPLTVSPPIHGIRCKASGGNEFWCKYTFHSNTIFLPPPSQGDDSLSRLTKFSPEHLLPRPAWGLPNLPK